MKTDLGHMAIDTNIFLYAHFPFYDEHAKVYSVLEDMLKRGENFYLSWGVYYEYIRVVTHPKFTANIKFQAACSDMQAYLDLPQCLVLQETSGHTGVLKELGQSLPSAKGNFVHDMHYAAILHEHGVKKILTCDEDFRKFDFLTMHNPLR